MCVLAADKWVPAGPSAGWGSALLKAVPELSCISAPLAHPGYSICLQISNLPFWLLQNLHQDMKIQAEEGSGMLAAGQRCPVAVVDTVTVGSVLCHLPGEGCRLWGKLLIFLIG